MSDGGERDALAYLAALTRWTETGFIELRLRAASGDGDMRPRFFAVRDLRLAVQIGLARAVDDDVYVGVGVRAYKRGGKDALAGVGAIWVDCDDRRALTALADFDPAPGIVVKTSADGAHALWPLAHPASVLDAERANRRLAHALGACQSAVTNAAAVLRLPATHNHKYAPAPRVQLVQFTGESFALDAIVGTLADPPRVDPDPVHQPVDSRVADPLLAIPPRVYVELLTGLAAGRDGKVLCPFHHEQEPSCHLYETADAGWFCFGCRAGGDVYNFGALYLGIPHRGPSFFDLQRELYRLLLPGVPLPPWP